MKSLSHHIQFNGVYTCHFGQSPGVGDALNDKRTSHSNLCIRAISEYSGMFYDVFLQDWSKKDFQFSWVAKFLATTGDILLAIWFVKQLWRHLTGHLGHLCLVHRLLDVVMPGLCQAQGWWLVSWKYSGGCIFVQISCSQLSCGLWGSVVIYFATVTDVGDVMTLFLLQSINFPLGYSRMSFNIAQTGSRFFKHNRLVAEFTTHS